MSKPEIWPELEVETLTDCRVFRVQRSRVRAPKTGHAHDFFRIDADDWVNVVALTPDDEIVMVRQFRHGSREVTLEIPGGIVDPGESPAEAAARELLEETGYAAGPMTPIGVVNPNPALFGNITHSFVSRGATRVAEICNETTEETVLELVLRSELPRLLRQGRIDHALVVAALFWFEMSER